MKVLVFDLGGTLMEYKGMPFSWVEYYQSAFEIVNNDFNLELSQSDIEKSCEIMKSKNARVVYREIEYTPEEVFNTVTEHWHKKAEIRNIVNSFYKGHKLELIIYDDTINCLERLRAKSVKIAVLTDLPTAMPDDLFKADIADLLDYFDLYVSSLTCGFRKPNKSGLLYIADYFGVNVSELVFVGDEEKDIKAAKDAGCASVLINRNGARNYGQDFTITSLNELLAVYHTV